MKTHISKHHAHRLHQSVQIPAAILVVVAMNGLVATCLAGSPACCLPDQSCSALDATACADAGGTAVSTCAGDCNSNGIADACDIAAGTSLDVDMNGIPDECCDTVPPQFIDPLRNRYISLSNVGTPGMQQAIRITFGSNAAYQLAGQSLWVGPPGQYLDPSMNYANCMMTAASLSCTPYYRDWSDIHRLNIYGAEIVPESTYFVQMVNEGCAGLLEANYPEPLEAHTGHWGDISLPFAGGSSAQPDFGDIGAGITAFLGTGTGSGSYSATKAEAQLHPNTAIPQRAVDFTDISDIVDAFLGRTYVATVVPFGPCTCPSDVNCGATACTIDSQCANAGLCIDGFCTDACGRCTQ